MNRALRIGRSTTWLAAGLLVALAVMRLASGAPAARRPGLVPGGPGLATLVWLTRRRDTRRNAGQGLDERTEIDRLQAAVAMSERRFRDLIHGLDAVVWEAETDAAVPLARRYTFVSQWAETALGYPAGRWIADPGFWAEIIAPEDREQVESQTRTALTQRRDHEIEYRARGGDGQIVWLREVVRVRTSASGALQLSGVMVDVTARQLLESQLRQAQKMDAIGRLAGGVAHDFNNLLTVITGYCEQMLGELPATDPLRAGTEAIAAAADRAVSLTRQLLAFSRRQIRAPRVLDLNAVVAGMDTLLRRVIGEDIALTIAPASALWRIRADPNQLEQVILNLAVNARDAMPGGGTMTIETANVELAADYYAARHLDGTPGPYVLLAVSDTGCGMSRDTLAHIFEPFFTTKAPGKGTGLGLSTVYGIAKQNGGYVWAYSEVDRGTTFKVYLPRVVDPLDAITPTPAVDLPRGSETVLLVEDDDAVRQIEKDTLRHCGYTVLEARNGSEAQLFAERYTGTLHLLLTDIVMPQMNGCEVAAALLRYRPGLQILYVSGYTDHAVVHHTAMQPGTDFLQKPFTPGVLARKVRSVLDRARDARGG
jgi:PAS domain S-box-containing protein